MKLGGNSTAGIRYRDENTVGTPSRVAPAIGGRRSFRDAALPEMRFGDQGDAALCRRVLEGVVEQVRDALLNLLIIELEGRQVRVNLDFETDLGALKCVLP